MAHGKLRHENNCLNCNAIVQGKFCGICGQENLETGESIGALIRHFFEDITHFDGKFFSTLKYLMLKPGFLSSEYKKGKKAKHLNPVRMYIFTSFFFFLIVFTTSNFDKQLQDLKQKENLVQIDVDKLNDSTFKLLSKELYEDSIVQKSVVKKKLSRIKSLFKKENKELDDYIKGQDTARIKDNAVERYFNQKRIATTKKYNGNLNLVLAQANNIFTHSFPQLLFASLPLVAMLLGLLYRSRKEYTLAHHGIFIVHYYIFLFINILLIACIERLRAFYAVNFLSYLKIGLILYCFYYLFAGLRHFYEQGKRKTALKFILFFLGVFLVMLLLITIFGIIAFLKV